MNNVLKTTIAIAIAATFFTGCSLDEVSEDLNTDLGSGGGSNSSNDSLTVSKTGEGFLVTWTKKASGYGEIIYTDGTTGLRGNGYPLTSNSTGTFFLDCRENSGSVDRVGFTCDVSNISGMTKSVSLAVGTPYQWLVSYGTNHEHGEVEAVMEYTGGTLTIE